MMNSTNFANSKQRVIRMGPRGGFYVAKNDGGKKRNPVAKFRKAADGSMVKLTKANLSNVPKAIRPARAPAAKAAPKRMSPGTKASQMFTTKVLNKKPRARKANSPATKATKMEYRQIYRNLFGSARKPRGRKPMSESARATKMFAKILNKKVPARKPKAAKVAAKNVIVVSPGGTLYKSKRSEMALKRARAQKKMRRQNPFAALNQALMR